MLLGGGCASLAAAETLRQEGFTGRIVMVTKESHLYLRCTVSKIEGNKTAETLPLNLTPWQLNIIYPYKKLWQFLLKMFFFPFPPFGWLVGFNGRYGICFLESVRLFSVLDGQVLGPTCGGV